MSRIVHIGSATLHLGDCRELLPTLSKVNAIVTDPPYELEAGGNTTGEMRGKFAKGRYDNSGSIIPVEIGFDEFMPLCSAVLDDGHAYFMVNNRHVQTAIFEAERAGFRFHNLLVWDKITATPNRWYMKNCEFTAFMFRGKGKMIRDCSAKQLLRCPNVINGEHETQKPVALMKHYIGNSTERGEIVLDPFMGSGTTGVAALQMGRSFVGIEREERYFDIACRRLESAQRQGDMFIDAESSIVLPVTL